MEATLWMAIRSTGKFRVGRYYTKEQLGVLGRMAVRAGYLIPTQAPAKLAKRPQKATGARKRRGVGQDKGVAGEPGGAQPGSGPGVRDQGGDS